MATSTNFQQDYQRAEAAYMDGNFSEAAALVYQLVEDFPEDPSARLLCGHIYCYGLQQYEVAREQYTVVLGLSDDPTLVEHAHSGITCTDQFLSGEVPTENFEALSGETQLEFYPDLSLDEGLEDPDLELFQGNSPSLSYRSQSPDDMENEDLADLGMSGLEWEPEDMDVSAGSVPDLTSRSNPFASDSSGMAAYAETSDSLNIDEFADSDFGDPFAADDGGLDADDGQEQQRVWEKGTLLRRCVFRSSDSDAQRSKFCLKRNREFLRLERTRLPHRALRQFWRTFCGTRFARRTRHFLRLRLPNPAKQPAKSRS
jgi:hypothetical protein